MMYQEETYTSLLFEDCNLTQSKKFELCFKRMVIDYRDCELITKSPRAGKVDFWLSEISAPCDLSIYEDGHFYIPFFIHDC